MYIYACVCILSQFAIRDFCKMVQILNWEYKVRMVTCAVRILVFEIETNKINKILMVVNRTSNTFLISLGSSYFSQDVFILWPFSITVQIASWEMLSVSDLFEIKYTEFPLNLHILPAIFLILIC